MNLTQCRPEPSTAEPDPIPQSTPLNTNDTDHMVLESCMDGQEQLFGECAYSLTTYLITVDATYELNTGSIDVHEEPGPEPYYVGGKFLLVVLSIM